MKYLNVIIQVSRNMSDNSIKKIGLSLLVTVVMLLGACENAVPEVEAEFTVTIRNLFTQGPPMVLSEGVFYTHEDGFPLFFTSSMDYGEGLELLAEDGIADQLLTSLEKNKYVNVAGDFIDILPGESVSFKFTAKYGEFFNLATMFTASNDAFYSFDEEGIFLFEADGTPLNGDITTKIWLWDAGTEQNEPPFEGVNQPTNPPMIDAGVETMEGVRLLVDDRFPGKNEVIQVLIEGRKL
ncbi:MAG: spondin domain-containing protein [Bacteroidota bacterium]